MSELVYWYCRDCGAKGYERGAPGDYETHVLIGVHHRKSEQGKKCIGMHIVWGGKSVWPKASSGSHAMAQSQKEPDAPDS